MAAQTGPSNTMNVTFSIVGTNTGPVDVFGTTHLAGGDITNSGPWYWLGQGYTCMTYSLTLTDSVVFLVLGTSQDSDSDGLTDAYELLVSRTDPNNPDSCGTGLLDGWYVAYHLDPSVDPYAQCPSGDGWTILQACQNGWNPNDYHTPPPPQNVAAKLDSTGTNVIITWTSGGGPVSNYVVQALHLGGFPAPWWETVGQAGPSTISFTNSLATMAYGVPLLDAAYLVSAFFADGSHADSQLAPLCATGVASSMVVVRGPLGQPCLALGPAAPDSSRVRLYWLAGQTPGWIDLYGTNFVNGVALLPPDQMLGYSTTNQLCVQCTGTNGGFIAQALTWAYPSAGQVGEKDWSAASLYSFVDARLHLKENLKFLLRAATLNHPFSYVSDRLTSGGCDPFTTGIPGFLRDVSIELPSPETWYARAETPTNYEYCGFHVFSPGLDYSLLQELRPVQENYLWRDLAFSPANYDAFGNLTNGIFGIGGGLVGGYSSMRWLGTPMAYLYGTVPGGQVPLVLDSTNSSWVYGAVVSEGDFNYDSAEVGLQTVTNATDINAQLPSNLRNCFGLTVDSLKIVDEGNGNGPDFLSLSPAGPPIPLADIMWDPLVDLYAHCDVPAFQTVDYYFASQTPYLTKYLSADFLRYTGPPTPMPGSPSFSVTNASPLLITGFAQPISVSGWAKMAITNGYTNKFAYLEQYFDQALTIDANSAGILSPYGDFFPTMPGPVALVTMPDIDTGQRGTGVVNVIKLQLDVNHDGIMDLSFAGPDNTSPDRPFVFWINNDCDWNSTGYDAVGRDVEPSLLHQPDYRNACINSWRDLEDYARLWICGMPALWAGNGYQVTLSWANVSSGSPSVKLFQSVEPDGGTRYLTDTNVAAAQTGLPLIFNTNNFCYVFATLTNGATFTFPASFFTNNANKFFLFEGAGAGRGELVLAINQNGQTIAQTGAWLDLQDIKDLYERARATNIDVGGPPSAKTSWTVIDEQLPPNPAEAPQLILYVHGAGNTPWLYENKSETMFKRLYWQGYQGRFASFRWPSPKMGLFALGDDEATYTEYNREEYIAFKSGAALKDYIANLRGRLPGYTINLAPHSCGGIVVNEAIREGALVDNVAMMQAAVPAECFDGNNTNLIYTYLATAPGNTPDQDGLGGYNNCFTNAPRRVNFYNDDDYNLFTGIGQMWVGNQYSLKPYHHGSVGGSEGYSFDGTNCFLIDYDPDGFQISSRTVTDDHEKKAFVARSRTRAVGQAGLKYSPFALTSGSVTNNVSLQDPALGFVGGAQFGNSRLEHSGQFTKPIQDATPFYRQLLRKGFNIVPPP